MCIHQQEILQQLWQNTALWQFFQRMSCVMAIMWYDNKTYNEAICVNKRFERNGHIEFNFCVINKFPLQNHQWAWTMQEPPDLQNEYQWYCSICISVCLGGGALFVANLMLFHVNMPPGCTMYLQTMEIKCAVNNSLVSYCNSLGVLNTCY